MTSPMNNLCESSRLMEECRMHKSYTFFNYTGYNRYQRPKYTMFDRFIIYIKGLFKFK